MIHKKYLQETLTRLNKSKMQMDERFASFLITGNMQSVNITNFQKTNLKIGVRQSTGI